MITGISRTVVRTLRAHALEIAVFAAIIAAGIFVRAYHFSDWLHFEIDQTYDFNIVSQAITGGIGKLTLLGPTAGGGRALRLGPVFYYLQYLSALVFGNTPTGHAMNILILSVLSLPLFYLFCRRYFETAVSLGLLAIYSFSFYSVLYSRFSWSPNVLPFLILLSFFALLRSVSRGERHPARWFLLSVAAVTATSQIHFNAFFTVPLIAVVFTAIKRPRFDWKVWIAGIGIIFVLYSPVILSDLKTHGEDLHLFKTKFLKTSSRTTSIPQTLSQDILYNAYEYFFIVTADDQINGYRLSGSGFACTSCREQLPVKLLALALFAASCAVLGFRLLREKDPEKRDFLVLTLLWLLVSGFLYYSLDQGYRLFPRFFLLISPLAIVMYGFILDTVSPARDRMRFSLFIVIIALIVGLNIRRLLPAFDQLRTVGTVKTTGIEMGDIFPVTNRITLSLETRIADYIASVHRTDGFPVYLSSKSEYEPAFWVLLGQRGIPYYDSIGDRNLYAQGDYFEIKFAGASSEIDPHFAVAETRDFGTLTVYRLRPLQQYVTAVRQSDNDRKTTEEATNISRLLTWSDLFGN